MERLTKENECQRQDIGQLQFINKILEERIHEKNIEQNNKGNDQTRVKKKGEKNDGNKGMKISKKKNGINSKLNSKLIFKCIAQEDVKFQ